MFELRVYGAFLIIEKSLKELLWEYDGVVRKWLKEKGVVEAEMVG